ncbi:MAG: hypothetical protein HOV81_15245 [Kofleriaceae bacterium]|nr:hypothetical protein [Kofleriaceae bacterium]
MPLSDYDYENRLSACAHDAYNSPTREKVEYVRYLMGDRRAKKLLKKWSVEMGALLGELCDPVKGELIIRIGEAEATRKPEPKQALKKWVSGSKELKAALERMPYFRDRYRYVTRTSKVKPLAPGFEKLQAAAARAFTKRLGRRRAQWIGGVFEQEFFYLAIDGEAEKVRDASLARALRDAVEEPIDGIDDDVLEALRRSAALVALGLWLREQKAKLTTLSDDLESPKRQVKVPKIAALRSTAARSAALDALCAAPDSRRLFERLLTRGKGPLLAALSR